MFVGFWALELGSGFRAYGLQVRVEGLRQYFAKLLLQIAGLSRKSGRVHAAVTNGSRCCPFWFTVLKVPNSCPQNPFPHIDVVLYCIIYIYTYIVAYIIS